MEVKVILLFVARDYMSEHFDLFTIEPMYGGVISTNPKLQVSDILAYLFERGVDLHGDWADFKYVDSILQDEVLNLVFTTQVPMDSPWKYPLKNVRDIEKNTPFYDQLMKAVRIL